MDDQSFVFADATLDNHDQFEFPPPALDPDQTLFDSNPHSVPTEDPTYTVYTDADQFDVTFWFGDIGYNVHSEITADGVWHRSTTFNGVDTFY